MNNKNKWVLMVLGLIVAAYLIWFFSNIVLYILISAVLSIMGHPLVALLDKIKIGGAKMPHTLSAILTLIVIYAVIFGFFAVVLPVLFSQIQSLAMMDPLVLIDSIKEPLNWLNSNLTRFNLIPADKSIEMLITDKVVALANDINFTIIANKVISLTGSIFIAIFSVGFITFFFLKQERMFLNGIMLFTPEKHQSEIKHVYFKIGQMLSKYFLGLSLDLFIVMTLITIGTWMFGFENAIMIGFFAGITNIIPYIGPFIGWGLAMTFAVSGVIDNGLTLHLLPVFIKISGIFIFVNLLDEFVVRPTIYSNVVKAHPLEIFLVIIMAGSIAGIPGMILAIPAYSALRIIAKEFLHKYSVVKKITRDI